MPKKDPNFKARIYYGDQKFKVWGGKQHETIDSSKSRTIVEIYKNTNSHYQNVRITEPEESTEDIDKVNLKLLTNSVNERFICIMTELIIPESDCWISYFEKIYDKLIKIEENIGKTIDDVCYLKSYVSGSELMFWGVLIILSIIFQKHYTLLKTIVLSIIYSYLL